MKPVDDDDASSNPGDFVDRSAEAVAAEMDVAAVAAAAGIAAVSSADLESALI